MSVTWRTICLLLAFCLASAATANARQPNIIFVIADDMQRDMFNCLPQGRGKNLTPNLDRLASEGTLLLQQYVSSPVCTPSRYACLTGRYASRARNASFCRSMARTGQSVVGWNTKIMPDDATLPKALQQAGYRTGMVGKNHVVDVPGLRKIAYQEDPNDPRVKASLKENQQTVQRAIRRCGFDYAGSIYNNNPDGNGPRALAVHNLDWITQAGLDFITRYKDEPFFLYFASTVPHGPSTAERSWNADRRITAAGILDAPLCLLPPQQTLPERLQGAGIPVTNNRANLLWLDDAIGALLGKLREYQLQDDTLIIFFNDHGQKAKGTLYQGGINDPSIVWRSGGWACGGVCRTRVSNIDFAPTILDLAGAKVPANLFDGKSFRAALAGARAPIHESLYFEMGYSRAVIKGKWKYLALRYPDRAHNMPLDERTRILERFNAKQREHGKRIVTTDPSARFSHISLIPGGGGAEAASTGKYPGYYDADQLYDLTRDPREQVNLAKDPHYAGLLKEMQRALRNVLDDLPGGFGELKPSTGYREE